MNEIILVDTGYWLALLDPRDQHHGEALDKEEWLQNGRLLMPWPILYETVRTRLVRRPAWMARFDRLLKRASVLFVDDVELREEAYDRALEYATELHRPISMVDMLCRLLIADRNTRIDALLTMNPADFRDVCVSRGVIIL